MQLLYFRSFLSATTSADSDKKSNKLKQQPIPSASSIRPLLMKASGLLQEVGTPVACHHASTCCFAYFVKLCLFQKVVLKGHKVLAMQVCQAGCEHKGLVVCTVTVTLTVTVIVTVTVTAGCIGAPLPAEASCGSGQMEACAGCFGGCCATDLSYGVSP